jgi:hypothetical protein
MNFSRAERFARSASQNIGDAAAKRGKWAKMGRAKMGIPNKGSENGDTQQIRLLYLVILYRNHARFDGCPHSAAAHSAAAFFLARRPLAAKADIEFIADPWESRNTDTTSTFEMQPEIENRSFSRQGSSKRF